MGALTESAIKKLKVNELKAELSKRGLNVKGKKDELIKRLMEAIEGGSDEEVSSAEEGVAEVESMYTEEPNSKVAKTEEDKPEDATVENEFERPMSTDDEPKVPDSSCAESVVAEPIAEEYVVVKVPGDDVAGDVEKAAKVQDAVLDEQEVMEGTVGSPMETSEPQKLAESTQAKITDEVSADALIKEAEMKESPKKSRSDKDNKDKTDKEGRREDKSSKKEEKKEQAIPDVMVDVEVEEGEEFESFDMSDGKVVLDPYLSDIHFVISNDGICGHNLVKNGFHYMWAGAMANKGAKGGKIGYEVKIVSFSNVDLPENEAPINAVRIGWSSENSSLQLGESGFSYGFESTGKICASSSFFDYGEKFSEGDVIGTYLDFESEPKTLTYTKNGENLGVAVSLTVNLDGKPLFPHVFLRNMKVELNFGGNNEPWFPSLEGYALIEKADAETIADKSCVPPAEFSDCEIYMMVGLPSCGKTTWVKKYVESHRNDRFTVIGVKHIMERCKLEGKHRKKSDPNTEKLMKSVIQILTKLYQLCPKRKRNYIFDQNNAYKIAQQTKMAPFSEFKKKAVVVIPTHDNLRRRTSDSKRRSDNIHEVPFGDLCDMKCQFHTPVVGDVFQEVIYPELDEHNAAKTIRDYKNDGARAMRTGRDEYHTKRKRFDERSNYSSLKRDNRYSGHVPRRDDGWKSSGSGYGGGYGGYGGNKGRSNYGPSSGSGGYKVGRPDTSKTYYDPYRKNTSSGSAGYRSQSYVGNSNYRGTGGYSSSNRGSSNYGGGYGSYSSGGNYNSYNQSNSNRGNSGGHWGGQYGSSNQSSQNQQWNSSSGGNWGGYNNYNSGNYGSGGGYSY